MLQLTISGQTIYINPEDVNNISVNLTKGTIDVSVSSENSDETVKIRSVHEEETPAEMLHHCLDLMSRLGEDIKVTGNLDITTY